MKMAVIRDADDARPELVGRESPAVDEAIELRISEGQLIDEDQNIEQDDEDVDEGKAPGANLGIVGIREHAHLLHGIWDQPGLTVNDNMTRQPSGHCAGLKPQRYRREVH